MSGFGAHTVEKIGGTSMAATDAIIANVFLKDRKEGDYYRRIFVVSAYAGVTNALLEDKKTGEPGVFGLFASAESDMSWSAALSKAADRMCAINGEIFADKADRNAADNFMLDRIEGVRSCLLDLHRLCSYGPFSLSEHLDTVREMLTALGEAHSAHNTTLLLRKHGVNAVFVDLTGWRSENKLTLDEKIVSSFDEIDLSQELPIVTGYAQCREGMANVFGRGYTEVTFSRIAVLTRASEAVIHKEIHLSSADPKIVGAEKVRKIGRTNYDVADQLSNMGMEAIHPRAAKGLRQAGIPLRVKNTFEPNDAGTVICSDYVSAQPGAEIVTGRCGVLALEFFEQDMVGVKGYDAAILATLDRHAIGIISKSSNANTITHYLRGSLKAVKRAIKNLEEQFPTATISIRKVAIISAIGSDLKTSKLTAKATAALAEADVDVLGLHQPMRNIDIQFIIDEEQYQKGISALHQALIEERSQASARKSGAKKAA
ncbi:MAG: aspartate kinase [Alphaproteobacteria bacterium]|nr:aspartate kinase [Alphaproteobacteria bacterium]